MNSELDRTIPLGELFGMTQPMELKEKSGKLSLKEFRPTFEAARKTRSS